MALFDRSYTTIYYSAIVFYRVSLNFIQCIIFELFDVDTIRKLVRFPIRLSGMAVSLTVRLYSASKNSVTLKTRLGLFKVTENGAVR